MELTPEQRAANDALEQAIHEACHAYDVVAQDELVVAWVVAGCTVGLDADKTGYFTLVPNGSQPNHIAVGLLRCAETHLLKVDEE